MLGNIPLWWNCTIQVGNKWRAGFAFKFCGSITSKHPQHGCAYLQEIISKIDREDDDKHDKPVDGMVFSHVFLTFLDPKNSLAELLWLSSLLPGAPPPAPSCGSFRDPKP